ncbi:hypothetical protein ACF08N_36600 [Streptomyces sp. NPDC015127]|uniref:hypothetical protein n=1 Tax=Streptomyces sp. NPDC015127 TaxID=3364939 RepID=UPI0036F8FACB
MRDNGGSVPLAYEPHRDAPTQPWAEYCGETGLVVARHASSECTWATVTEETEVIPGQTVERSVVKRLKQRGIECSAVRDGAGTHCQAAFADGSYLTFFAEDRWGGESSVLHPIAEHGSLGMQWISDTSAAEEVSSFATGVYADDSAALVARITVLADRHGRAPARVV